MRAGLPGGEAGNVGLGNVVEFGRSWGASSLSAGEERVWGTVPPAGARVGVQLSHTKA